MVGLQDDGFKCPRCVPQSVLNASPQIYLKHPPLTRNVLATPLRLFFHYIDFVFSPRSDFFFCLMGSQLELMRNAFGLYKQMSIHEIKNAGWNMVSKPFTIVQEFKRQEF